MCGSGRRRSSSSRCLGRGSGDFAGAAGIHEGGVAGDADAVDVGDVGVFDAFFVGLAAKRVFEGASIEIPLRGGTDGGGDDLVGAIIFWGQGWLVIGLEFGRSGGRRRTVRAAGYSGKRAEPKTDGVFGTAGACGSSSTSYCVFGAS